MIDDLLNLTTNIVSHYVTNNQLAVSDLPDLIRTTYRTLGTIDSQPETEVVGSKAPAVASTSDVPIVPAKKSLYPDHIVCMCCGEKQKMLKRHLMTSHGMTPDDYRTKWGLPASYPMVCPEYSKERSGLAKKFGLGVQRKAR